MKEHPIIFRADSVRAILDGRKTQTRRVVKGIPSDCEAIDPTDVPGVWYIDCRRSECGDIVCPYQPGSRLWVRETWVELLATSPATDSPLEVSNGDRLIEPPTRRSDGRWHYDGKVIAYRATSSVEFCDGDGFSGEMADRADMPRWKSPIYMPRWASRLTLEVKDVRVERLQDITDDDADEEGFDDHYLLKERLPSDASVYAFRHAWDDINGKKYPWESNPWVFVVEFKRTEAAIDTTKYGEGE